ncbi:MAG: hypothetical protein IJ730_08110 [Alphaproteobacteria bacterium]|nr:hypothetical protein [Alphaproteobacteria bacterium]
MVFSFKFMVRDEYSLFSCSQEEKNAFLKTMEKLSQLTWENVMSINRHKLGCEHISQKSIKTPIPSYITPDTQLIAFRFSGKKAMVGFRNRDTFYIIWFDKDFSLYKHG